MVTPVSLEPPTPGDGSGICGPTRAERERRERQEAKEEAEAAHVEELLGIRERDTEEHRAMMVLRDYRDRSR